MSNPFLFTDENNPDIQPPPSSSFSLLHQPIEQLEEDRSILPTRQTVSLLSLLPRLSIHGIRILSNKIRLIFTHVYLFMLNITARITCFMQQRTLVTPSSLTTTVTSSLLPALEEDLKDSSQSFLSTDPTTHLSPSFDESTMANILVRQQQMHRSPNMNIHSSTSALSNGSKLSMAHSVDERLFLPDSNQLIHLFKRFASEPHISNFHQLSNDIDEHSSSKSSNSFALSTPVSSPFQSVKSNENDEIYVEDIFHLNCDKIQPVYNVVTEDINGYQIDDLIPVVTTPIEIPHDQVNYQQFNEDILLDTSPSPTTTSNGHELPCERHFRRRKRRSSLTKNSLSLDETQSIGDSLDKLDNHSQQISSEASSDNLTTKSQDVDPTEDNQSPEPVIDDAQAAPMSRYRGRRLRHRFYRQAASVTSPTEVIGNVTPEYQLPTEALNVETPRTPPRPSSPVILSPIASSISPTLTITPNSNSDTGALKTTTTNPKLPKKFVRFADSVGLELAQVQYIRPTNIDESKEFSFLLGSSLFSSSPPSFSKNHLYLPNSSRLEHKPWSFDVALKSNHQTLDISIPRRFSCLYRQPNSEHADIYLHEIWKSQIKLEHADIPLNCSSTGEQHLIGTLWVTNASFWKYVSVKYTFNRWLNTYEFEAQHRTNSNDFRNIDQFEFTITIPNDVDRIDFVLRYCVNGQEYWDNNDGKNYTLSTESAYTPSKPISLPHDCDFNEMRFY